MKKVEESPSQQKFPCATCKSISQQRLSQNVQDQVGIPPPNLEPSLAASLIEKRVSQGGAKLAALPAPKSCNHASLHLEREQAGGWLVGELCVTEVVSSSSVLDIVSKLPVGFGTSAKSVMKSLGADEGLGWRLSRQQHVLFAIGTVCSPASTLPVSPPAALL